MKIVVTGASGLLGANLILELDREQHEIFGVYHKNACVFPQVDTLSCDLTDADDVFHLIERIKPDWILHCAAMTDLALCESDINLALQGNVDTTRNLACAAASVDSRFLYISTDCVFDGIKGDYSEGEATSPLNHYAKSKLAGELAAIETCPSSLIIRTNIFGWNMREKFSLSEWVLDNLSQRNPIFGFSDVYFSPLLVNDLSRIIIRMIEVHCNGVYHVGSSDYCTKYEFAVKLAKLFGFDASLISLRSVDKFNFKAKRPKKIWLNSKKLLTMIPGLLLPSVDEGLLHFKNLKEIGFVDVLKSCIAKKAVI